MKTVSLARNAMATRFEMVLHGEDELGLRAAGEEALDEILAFHTEPNDHRPAVLRIDRALHEALLDQAID